MPVEILESSYIEATNTYAIARIAGDDRWLAYCPSDSSRSHWKIRTAQLDGTLTGKTMPSPYVPPALPNLDEVKAAKIIAIDAKTQELIKQGFSWQGNNFSMSQNAQLNWVSICAGLGKLIQINADGTLNPVVPVSTVTEGSGIILSTLADITGFLGAYMTYQLDTTAPLSTGRLLKAMVDNCTTVAEVDAIRDNR